MTHTVFYIICYFLFLVYAWPTKSLLVGHGVHTASSNCIYNNLFFSILQHIMLFSLLYGTY